MVAVQMPRFVLSPHIYPSSVTGAVDEIEAALETITYRWDQSWGWKMQGVDTTLQVQQTLQALTYKYEILTACHHQFKTICLFCATHKAIMLAQVGFTFNGDVCAIACQMRSHSRAWAGVYPH